MKLIGALFAVFLLLFVIAGINKSREPERAPDREADAALMAVVAVKKSQRNPDAFVLERAVVMEKTVCLEWRGQNGFGGMNRGRSVIARNYSFALNDRDSGFIAAWNRECASKTGRDLTDTMQGQLRFNSALAR